MDNQKKKKTTKNFKLKLYVLYLNGILFSRKWKGEKKILMPK